MCTIDVLQSLAEINSIMNKLSLSSFDIFNQNSMAKLNKVEFVHSEGKEKIEPQPIIPESVYNDVQSAFIMIISLVLKDSSSKNRERVKELLTMLKDIISSFPKFVKQKIDIDTQGVVNRVISSLQELNDVDLTTSIVICKNVIYTTEQ